MLFTLKTCFKGTMGIMSNFQRQCTSTSTWQTWMCTKYYITNLGFSSWDHGSHGWSQNTNNCMYMLKNLLE